MNLRIVRPLVDELYDPEDVSIGMLLPPVLGKGFPRIYDPVRDIRRRSTANLYLSVLSSSEPHAVPTGATLSRAPADC